MLFDETAALAGFSTVDNGHVHVFFEHPEVAPHQTEEFFDGFVGTVENLPEAVERQFGLVAEKMYQNVIFIFKIKIDRAVSNSGFFSDL